MSSRATTLRDNNDINNYNDYNNYSNNDSNDLNDNINSDDYNTSGHNR